MLLLSSAVTPIIARQHRNLLLLAFGTIILTIALLLTATLLSALVVSSPGTKRQMERSFGDPAAAASILNLSAPPSNRISLHISTQQPSLQARAPGLAVSPSLIVRAALPGGFPSLAATLPRAAYNPLAGYHSHFLSPDPPASGPSTNMPPANTARSRRRTARRASPADEGGLIAAAAAAAAAAADHSTSAHEPVRRSSRTRKRPPTVASIEASGAGESRDPPAKRPKRSNLKAPPAGPKTDQSEDATKLDGVKAPSCCICMEEPKPADLASINGCEHYFCFDCIEKWAERENSCPLCKVRFTKIDRVHKAKKKTGERAKNTKRVKQKDQRSDLAPGAALEGLLASFASSANFPPHRVARLIFSGMGGNPFMLPGSAALRNNRSSAAAAAARASSLEDSLLSSDTDDDEDTNSFLPAGNAPPSFADLFRPVPLGGGRGPGFIVETGLRGLRPVGVPGYEPSGRSYASNVSDRNAGRQAENPLEIDDDSDDDEEVEVVQVTRRV